VVERKEEGLIEHLQNYIRYLAKMNQLTSRVAREEECILPQRITAGIMTVRSSELQKFLHGKLATPFYRGKHLLTASAHGECAIRNGCGGLNFATRK